MALILRLSVLTAIIAALSPPTWRAHAQPDSVEVNLDVLDRYSAPTADSASARRRLPLPPGLSDGSGASGHSEPRRSAAPPPPPAPKPAMADPTRLTPARATTPDRPSRTDTAIPPPVEPLTQAAQPDIPAAAIEPVPMPDATPLPERPRAVVSPPDPAETPAASAQQAAPPAQTARLDPGAAQRNATAAGIESQNPGRLRLPFAPSESAIGQAAEAKLTSVAAWLAQHPRGRLQVIAYADGESRSRARQLSFRRGLAVRSWLLQNGVSDARIDVSVKGREAEGGPLDRVDLRLDEP